MITIMFKQLKSNNENSMVSFHCYQIDIIMNFITQSAFIDVLKAFFYVIYVVPHTHCMAAVTLACHVAMKLSTPAVTIPCTMDSMHHTHIHDRAMAYMVCTQLFVHMLELDLYWV